MARIAAVPAIQTPDPAVQTQSRWLIRPAQVRALFWLSAKLRLRGYTRNWRQTVGLVVLLVFLVPLAVAVGVSSWFAYTWLDHDYAVELLFVVLFGLYVLWAILPLLQYTLNEGLDVTRLQTYPVTRAEQMVALVLVTLMDVSTLFIVGLFVAILVGWSANPIAIAFTFAALAFAYIHIVSLSQLVLATLMGLLRSRRYRDLSIILFAFFGAACSFSSQIISYLLRDSDLSGLINLPVVGYLRWTPPGMAAQAIVRANEGAYGEAALWLVALVALIPLVVALWAVVLDRGITTAEAGGAARGGRRAASAPVVAPIPAAKSTRARRTLIPAPVRAVAGKDLRYFWRDPQLKAMILSSLLILVFIFLPRLTAGTGGVPLQQWVPRLVPRLRRAASRDLPLAQPLAERLRAGAASGADALPLPRTPAPRPPGQEPRGGLCGDPGAAGLDARSGGAFRQVGGCAHCVHRRYRGHAGDDGLWEYHFHSAAFARPADADRRESHLR